MSIMMDPFNTRYSIEKMCAKIIEITLEKQKVLSKFEMIMAYSCSKV